MLFCSLSSHRDLHKNKGHKSVLVRKNALKPPPSVMVAFGVIFHHHEQGWPYLSTLGVDLRGPTAFGERDAPSWIESMPLC